mgnify:CR=1 FL=1|tara:strand:- start:8809 stop:8946 length:138 start_codon:yes stop_codon:yes gene_type:complete
MYIDASRWLYFVTELGQTEVTFEVFGLLVDAEATAFLVQLNSTLR